QTCFRVVEAAPARTVGADGVERRLRRSELILPSQRLGLDEQRLVRHVHRERRLWIGVACPRIEQRADTAAERRRRRHEVLPAQVLRLHRGAILSTRRDAVGNRKSTRLNSSHVKISYAVFCLKKK